MPEFKRDPAGVPQEITNRIAKRILDGMDKTDGYAALGNLHQLGADHSGDPAGDSGDTGGEVFVLNTGKVSGLRPGPSLEKQHLWAAAPELLEAAKLAYRKHHLGDPDIGWDELSEKLLDALCNAMGDKAFRAWMKPYGQSQEDV